MTRQIRLALAVATAVFTLTGCPRTEPPAQTIPGQAKVSGGPAFAFSGDSKHFICAGILFEDKLDVLLDGKPIMTRGWRFSGPIAQVWLNHDGSQYAWANANGFAINAESVHKFQLSLG